MLLPLAADSMAESGIGLPKLGLVMLLVALNRCTLAPRLPMVCFARPALTEDPYEGLLVVVPILGAISCFPG